MVKSGSGTSFKTVYEFFSGSADFRVIIAGRRLPMMSAHVPMTLKTFYRMTALMVPLGSRESQWMSKILRSRHTFFYHYFSCFPLHSPQSLCLWAESQEIPARPRPGTLLTPNLGLTVRERFFLLLGSSINDAHKIYWVYRQFDVLLDCRTWCGARWTWSRPGGRRRRRCCRTPG